MRTWTHVLIHHSATADSSALETHAIRRFHIQTNGWKDCGYHFLVEKVGDAYAAIVGRPLHQAGAHCPGMNQVAIGVCLVGGFNQAPPSAAQLICAAKLVAGLCEQFGIASAFVEPHKKYRSTDCPGAMVDLVAFRALVDQYRAD